MSYVGVDISKRTFVAAFPSAKRYKTKTFDNTPAGVLKFIKELSDDSITVLEATGNYSYLLIYMLHQANKKACMVNPKQIKHFGRMMLSVTKTDAKDACLIAQYGEKMTPSEYHIPSETMLILKQKRTVLSQLKKQLNATTNLLESIKVLPYQDQICVKSLNDTIDFMKKQIDSIGKDIKKVADSEFDKLMKLLTSIKGVGIALATALIVATGGFTYFNSAKQLSRYIGICPTICQSGSSININGHINRTGDPKLRSQLYISTWTAIRYNASCKEMYLRMRANGKPTKVALMAVANKLLRQCFAVVSSGTPYIDGYISEEPSVLSIALEKAKPNTMKNTEGNA